MLVKIVMVRTGQTTEEFRFNKKARTLQRTFLLEYIIWLNARTITPDI